MLCENPKTNVAAINSRKSRGKLKSLFLIRVIIVLTLFCHSGLDPESSYFVMFWIPAFAGMTPQ